MSGWKVYGNPILTADASAGVSQRVKFNSDVILKACRVWLIVYNNPSFTSMNMKIYSDRGGSPQKLLYTSTNSLTKAQIVTLANGIKEVYFEFDPQHFDGSDYYHFVLFGTGYTGTSSAHLAWKKAWPDPVHNANYTASVENLGIAPYAIYFIGADA